MPRSTVSRQGAGGPARRQAPAGSTTARSGTAVSRLAGGPRGPAGSSAHRTADPAEDRCVEGKVHCPLCTHTVEARIVQPEVDRWQVRTLEAGRGRPSGAMVVAGQRCPRCSSSLDAAYIIGLTTAA